MVRVRRFHATATTMELIRTKRVALITAVGLALLLLVILNREESGIFVELESSPSSSSSSNDKKNSQLDLPSDNASDPPSKSIPEQKADLSAFEGCTVKDIRRPETEPANVPFWVPSYPGSDNGVVSALVSGLTGATSSAKNYYARSPSLKKCFSASSLTVTCEQIHPIVAIGPAPGSQAHKFQPKIIFPIRNPLTVIPEHVQNKAVKYHKVQGQMPIAYWRQIRDDWLEAAGVATWMSVLTTWKNMTEYQGIGLYLPYEHLLDVKKGLAATSRLANMIRDAGFPVVDEDDIACVWYRAVKDRLIAATAPVQPLFYDYAVDYIPGYTAHQKEYMVAELTRYQAVFPDDVALVAILTEYANEIQKTTATDQPWENTTNARV